MSPTPYIEHSWPAAILLLFASIGFSSAGSIQGCSKWENLTVSGEIPKVFYHRTTSVKGSVVLFGGFDENEELQQTLWHYSISSKEWVHRNSTSHWPVGRVHHSFASDQMDSATEFVYLFGGQDGQNMSLDDFWRLNASSLTWDLIEVPSQRPESRYGHASVVLRDHIFIFGGKNAAGSDLNDLWIFTTDMNWTNLERNTTSWPPGRRFHSMSMTNGKIAMFGGIQGDSHVLDDFWLYDLDQTTWMMVNAVTRPSARYNHFMTSIASSLILFAGQTTDVTTDDIWAYEGHSWTLLQPSSSTSLLAEGISMALINEATLFVNGGKLSHTLVEDVWTYNTCICPAGTEIGIHGCVPCSSGYFKNATGNQSCALCSANQFSSNSRTTCLPCPANSVSQMGSRDVWNCSCLEGYEFEGGQNLVCSPCPGGSFKNASGNFACSPCPANTYSAQIAANSSRVCIPCVPNSVAPERSRSILNCSCIPGYHHELANSSTCSACPEGKYKDLNATSCFSCPSSTFADVKAASSVDMCKSCPTLYYWRWFPLTSADFRVYPQFNLSESSFKLLLEQCGCNQGEGLNPSLVPYCVPCEAGKYKDVFGPFNCSSCPSHMTSHLGSVVKIDCVCDKGYTGQDGVNCTSCPAGKFKSVTGSALCSSCPVSKYSSSLAAPDISACLSCPEHSFSPAASSLISDCNCNAGYAVVNETICIACVPGKYKNEVANKGCTDCTADSSALQPASKWCECNAGFEPQNPSSPVLACVLCPAGHYKLSISNASCVACKPWFLPRNASYVNPTVHDMPCLWDCLPGHYYVLSHLPNVYNEGLARSDYSNSLLPNICRPCSPVTSTNPCGSGEYYNCTAYSRDGCVKCSNMQGRGRYQDPNPSWDKCLGCTTPDCECGLCPYTCDQGTFKNGGTDSFPVCEDCSCQVFGSLLLLL